MLEIVTSTVGGIAAIFAIFGGVLTVIVFIRKKQFATPTLRFTVGPSMHVSDEFPRRHRKRPVSIIAYSADDTGSFPVIIPMIYSLENRGKEALRNLRLLIEYNKSFVMDNELLRSVTKFEPAVLSVKKDYLAVMRGATDEEIRKISERREVQVFGDRAQVSYEIPLIRPGESIVLCDTLMLQPRQICGLDGLGFGDKGFANILEQLRKIEGLHNFFVLNVWIFGENHEKKIWKFSFLRFSTGVDFKAGLQEFGKALWLGETPKSGCYLHDPISGFLLQKFGIIGRTSPDIYKSERGVMVFPKLEKIRSNSRKTYLVENLEQSSVQDFVIGTPNCDYFSLPEHVDNFENLRQWLGLAPLSIPRPKRAQGKKNGDWLNPVPQRTDGIFYGEGFGLGFKETGSDLVLPHHLT